MNILVAVVCALAAAQSVLSASTGDSSLCSSAVKISNKYFVKETLVTGITGEPNDLSIQDSTGDIFYTRINAEGEDDERLKVYVLKHGSGKPEEVKGLKGLGQSTTVDNDHDVVYISADSGLYSYNAESDTAKLVADEGTDIIHVYYSNGRLYSSVWPDYDVFSMNVSTPDAEKVSIDNDLVYGNYLVVDGKENYFFVGKTNYLYYYSKNYSEKIRYLGIAKEPSTIFAVDRKDNVYVTADKNIYKLSTDSTIPQYIGTVEFDITAFAFDSHNNIILGKSGEILKYNRVDC